MSHTVQKTIDILRLLSESDVGLGIAEIARTLKIPKSTTFDIVHTLAANDLLARDESQRNEYRLGLGAFQIGYSYMRRADLHTVALPVLEQTRTQVGNATVYLACRSGGRMVYLMKLEPNAPLQLRMGVGMSMRLLLTGLGKALLAGYDDMEVARIATDEVLSHCNVPSIRSLSSLLAYLNEARSRGYVIDNGEEKTHLIRSVAAPILQSVGQPIASVSIVGISEEMTEDRCQTLGRLVSDTCMDISCRLGFQGMSLYPAPPSMGIMRN